MTSSLQQQKIMLLANPEWFSCTPGCVTRTLFSFLIDNNNKFHLSQMDVDNDLIGDPCDTNKDRYCVAPSITSYVFILNDLCNLCTGDQNEQ